MKTFGEKEYENMSDTSASYPQRKDLRCVLHRRAKKGPSMTRSWKTILRTKITRNVNRNEEKISLPTIENMH